MDLNEDESEENKKKRAEIIAKDKERFKVMDQHAEELVKAMSVLKKIDELNKGVVEDKKEIKYVEREDDPELKKLFEEEQKRFEELHKDLLGKVDG